VLYDGHLAGLIVPPFRSKFTPVHFTLAITAASLIPRLSAVLPGLAIGLPQPSPPPSLFESQVVLVQLADEWASAVVIAPEFILTSAHTFKRFLVDGRVPAHLQPRIRVWSPRGFSWLPASLEYLSGTWLDAALLRCPSLTIRPLECRSVPLKEGELVRTVGYPVFPPDVDIGPTTTTGTLAKVVRTSRVEMLQTSAPVHFGNSGGLLLNSRGQFIGLVTAMAKAKRVLPNLNFSLPLEPLAPLIHYAVGGGVEGTSDSVSGRILQSLASDHNLELEALWRLSVPSLLSKL
jgi:hypothetical protein